MNEKIVNQILGYLDNLGKAISSGAKESFAIIVKQQVTIGVVDSFMSLVGIIVMIWTGFALLKYWRNYKVVGNWDETRPWILAGAVVSFLFGFLFLYCLSRSVMHIMNPEFFAIQYILNTITGNN